MKLLLATAFLVLLQVYHSSSQVPPRLQIPGAFVVGGGNPQQHAPPRRIPIRQQQQHQQPLYREDIPVQVRVRRPPPNALPTLLREQPIRQQEVRPVVEEHEEPERPALQPQHALRLDEEVARFAAAHEERERQRQVAEEPETERPVPQYTPQPIVFRPAPKAISQDDFRETPRPLPQQPVRQLVRQQVRPAVQHQEPIPVRKAPQVQQAPRRPQPAAPIAARRPSVEYDEDEDHQRRRKPTAQILRKYREDNPDGSITWGYENDDGSFKEENIGIDCITRGKYGYVDPEGVRREFAYETGNKCDKREEEELPLEEEILPQIKHAKRPHPLRI